jgi:ElaB/YqjD/DUF883 family membrane-anchored ribosome-binding protein
MSTKSMEEAGDISKEKLMRDLRLVVEDAEELLKATASQAGEKANAARERIQQTLAAAKARLDAAESEVIEKAKQAAKATDEYVQDNPWKAVGVAACVGVIVGMLIGRSR